ncbi:hypothetical protein [Desulfonema magnum]|uniref:Dockerin domain-containing protein n=1 Tax=Desulfonema magnum TaxID=45655 RepID=A0A975BJJ7_9BACT|nr:hypothetical protein [Desulfonema magnum]QTA86752.1 Uncharacterized protein dnm_027760 [Desulfonema magnum]
MKHRKHRLNIIFFILLFVCYTNSATGQQLGTVRNLASVTHDIDQPSGISEIKTLWDPPLGSPADISYYALFNTEAEYTFDDLNTLGIVPVKIEIGISDDYAESEPDDVAYYFHIAAVDEEGEIGLTASAGPYRIDVVPPSGISVLMPESISKRLVTLSLEAEGASEIYISNNYGGADGEWEAMTNSKEWMLGKGAGNKTVYVRFRDVVGNISEVSADTNFIIGDVDARDSQVIIDLKDLILALKVITGDASGAEVNPDADVNSDGKIGIEEAVYILRKLSQG